MRIHLIQYQQFTNENALTVNQRVVGSSPTSGAPQKARNRYDCGLFAVLAYTLAFVLILLLFGQ